MAFLILRSGIYLQSIGGRIKFCKIGLMTVTLRGCSCLFFSRELFFCYFVCTLNILRYLENYSFTGHDNCVFFIFMIILFNYYYFLALSFKKFVPDIIHFLLAFARLCYNNLICISSFHVDNNSQRLLLLFCPFCG